MSEYARVAHVTGALDRGGAERFVAALLPALADRGLECAVFTLGPRGELAPDLVAAGIPVHEVQLRRFYDPRRLGHALTLGSVKRERVSLAYRAQELGRALAPFGATVVHTHLLEPDVAGALTSEGTSVCRVSTQHDMFAPDDILDPGQRYLFDRKREFEPRLDGVVAISDAVAEFVQTRFGVDPSRIDVIPPGLDLERFRGTQGSGPVRVFGILGGLRRWKGHGIALDALASLARHHPDVELRIAGQGPMRSQLESRASEHDLVGRVSFLGSVQEPERFLAEIDALLVPSLTEGLGLVAIEAMAAGRPVIASAVGGLAEVVQPDVTGLLVPAGDSAALCTAMRRLVEDPSIALRMGARGVAAAKRFDIAVVAEAYDALYARLIQSAGGVRG